MTTALGIIKSAMKKSGILTKTETPTSDESADALETLNEMLSSWSNDGMTVYARTLESFAITPSVGSYTIGSGGDFDTARPVKIVSAYIRDGGIDYPLTLITDEAYAKISYKSQAATYPTYINFDNNFPLSTIKFYPVPTSGTLYLLSEKELSAFTLNQTVSLPSGWKRALVYNLAMELAPEYGQRTPDEVVLLAKQSKGEIRTAIMRNRTMDVTPTGVSRNIYTGW